MSDAGWYGDAEKVFLSCLQLCTLHSEVLHCFRAVECCVRSVYDCHPLATHFPCRASLWQHRSHLFLTRRHQCQFFSRTCHVVGKEPLLTTHLVAVSRRLLHVRNGNCKYHLGEETFKLAQSYMDKLAKHGHEANKAALYGELCALLFAKSHYDEVRQKKNMTRKHFQSLLCLFLLVFSVSVTLNLSLVLQAYRWCIEAMKEITPGLPVKVVVDVLRQASKVLSFFFFFFFLVIIIYGVKMHN